MGGVEGTIEDGDVDTNEACAVTFVIIDGIDVSKRNPSERIGRALVKPEQDAPLVDADVDNTV